jgi:tRNA nucleotidyltransferase (CCA-adding enzyme)
MRLADAGAKTFVVGGAVRDFCLTHNTNSVKDVDFEVYGLSYDDLLSVLSKYGKCDLVGKSFGVVKYTERASGKTFDFSIPRRDNKTGTSHKDFAITFDPTLTPKEAAARRDYTINSMMFDPLRCLLWDYYNGEADLRDRWLRHTTEAFAEDPLRVLRGMQFSARFGMRLAPETAELCRSIADQYDTLPKERVWEEWHKWATRAEEPARLFDFLKDSGWVKHYPELEALQGVQQDPEWHPEGDVWVHTFWVVNAAGLIAEREGLEGDDKAALLFTALLHDTAKPQTTVLREKHGKMRWTAYGHEEAGGPVARAFMERIGAPKALTEKVVALTVNHMKHIQFKDGVGGQAKNVRKLATNLGSATIRELVLVMESDCSGRPPLPMEVPPTAAKMRDLAEANGCLDGPLVPCVKGQDLLDRGLTPGPAVGEWGKKAFEAQLNNVFSTREEALIWLERHLFGSQKHRRTEAADSAAA